MFNLENAIKTWKKDFAKNPAIEETYIFELESVLRDEMADLVHQGMSEEEAFRRASSEMGEALEIGKEFSKVRTAGQRGFVTGPYPRFLPGLVGSYLRIALRKIRHQKSYTIINILSLAVGLACCIIMMLWVKNEMSFDRFHANGDSLYRVIMETKTANTEILDSRTPTPLGQALKDELPGILDFSRYQGYEGWMIKSGEDIYFDDILGFGDPSFFTMFSFPFIQGDPKTALVEPRSIVVTESMARKCFGDKNPMGKILKLASGRHDYQVTGVIRDIPENSHLRFDCMIPIINTVEYNHIDYNDWSEVFFYSYIQLAPHISAVEAAREISRLIGEKSSRPNVSVRLQSLKDVHLHSNFEWDLDNYGQGSFTALSTFTIAAVAILLLACINFMNLSTARSANRAKEVGLRKVTGASRLDIIAQFLGESVVISFISLFLALFFVYTALPLFNNLAGKQLTITGLIDVLLLPGLLGITLLTGLLSGSYPALFLSSFQPTKVLKGGFLSGGRSQAVMRKSLVVLQFTLTLFLVMGTIAVDKQLKYIQDKKLGINTHQVITFIARAPYEAMKSAFLANPNVLSVTRSLPPTENLRGISDVSWKAKNPEDIIQFYRVPTDADYLKTLGTEMAEGRFFSDKITTDGTEALILNQTAAAAMGLKNPIGEKVTFGPQTSPFTMPERTFSVIGVMKDFHQNSLHQAIEPMLFTMEGDQWPYVCVQLSPVNVEETLKFMGTAWKPLAPDYPFTYSFLDARIDSYYKSERKIESILGLFTILALFTASLGLFGLAAFIAEKKTKEIGIRKVLGASVSGLVLMQTRAFALWVLMANVIAWPAAYFVIGRWLQGFAYHIRPGVELAALAAAFSLSVALLTVGFQALKAARAYPAESLKYE
ncbi:ABC transporter permease [Acidobacteriota bacterium]